MKNFYMKFGTTAGLYAPNHYWTPWTYDPALLPDLGGGLKRVPATDSTVWSVRADIARKVGTMNLQVNKLGWGIEVVAAYYCRLANKVVARDYSVKCDHPCSTAYNRETADREWRHMIEKMGLGTGFWEYYDNRMQFGFGWQGDDEPEQNFNKMLL